MIRAVFADTVPLLPTAGKGRVTFETAVTHTLELVDARRARPIHERRNFHTGPVRSLLRW